MEIKTRTPRTEMALESLTTKMASFYEKLAEDLGYDEIAVDREMSRFAELSSRVSFGKGEVDFDLAGPSDTPDEVCAKFLVYVDTKCYEVAREAARRLAATDRPLVPAEQAPTPPGPNEKK